MRTKREKSLLAFSVFISLLLVESFGILVRYRGWIVAPGYQPGVTYACLYVREQLVTERVLGTEKLLTGTRGYREEEQRPFEENALAGETKEPVRKEQAMVEDAVEQPVSTIGEAVGDAWTGMKNNERAGEGEKAGNQVVEERTLQPMEMVSSFERVEDAYFEDALFIGDSRVVGLETYSQIPVTDYAAQIGLTVYRMMDKKILKMEDSASKQSIRELLMQKQYRKIYLMLGINELGTGNEEDFQKEFQNNLEDIIELQPEAVIFIQSVLHVTEKKSRSEKHITNENINVRNAGLADLADGKRIFYLDINSVYDDENGNLSALMSGDGVHLKAKYYEIWKEYLYSHGIVKDSLVLGPSSGGSTREN